MEKAKVRQKEWEIAYDAKLQKERKLEGDTFSGKEKFVTAAYKKKLIDDQRWKAEEERKAALEEDVTKKSNLNSFYANLLTNNEAYGTKDLGDGKKKQAINKQDEVDTRKSKDRDNDDENSERDSDREEREKSSDDEPREKRDKTDSSNALNGERHHRERNGKDKERHEKDRESKDKDREGEGRENKKRDADQAQETDTKKEGSEEKPTKVVKKLDESTVNAAKLRYLQRKGLA